MSDTSTARRRVVVTGMGAVTPIGLDVSEFWTSVKAGRCGISRIENWPVEDLYIHIAGEIKGFDPAKHVKSKKVQYGDRYSWFAGRAADEAWAQAGLPVPFDKPYRAASIIGSGAGGFSTTETAYRDLFILKKKATNPLTLLRIIGSSAAAHVGIEYGIKGPTFATCSACSTATHAIGIGIDYIRHGVCDVAVTGASEAVLTFGSLRVWQAMRVLSPDGLFPFSKKRNGTVLGEGAGVLILEELEHARKRGAKILAEVVGYGLSSDSKDMVNPDVEGPRSAMQMALDDAGIQASEVDYLNAHGTATTLNDVNETNAVKMVFGDSASKLAISSTKSMTGHLLGAGGAVEAIACIKAMEDSFIPATINLAEPDPKCDLDYVPNVGRQQKVRYAMSNSFAFGGLNAVLLFGPAP
ncbi:MAG: beta-ketoacyl-[acyl-carrier-protein] synthase family protein [Hyphomicrobiaceae bacterium]